MKPIDPSVLHDWLSYDEDTGILVWKERPVSSFSSKHLASRWNAKYARKEAFTATNDRGYKVGKLMKVCYRAHRVIWALMTGFWPEHEVDHINHDRSDNRWVNLRSVTHLENHQNVSKQKNNTSGVTGVVVDKVSGRCRAKIVVKGKSKHLGRFATKEEATKARKNANDAMGFHSNHGM